MLFIVEILLYFLDLDYFKHVTRDHTFQDGDLFYRFTEDFKLGGVVTDETGRKVP